MQLQTLTFISHIFKCAASKNMTFLSHIFKCAASNNMTFLSHIFKCVESKNMTFISHVFKCTISNTATLISDIFKCVAWDCFICRTNCKSIDAIQRLHSSRCFFVKHRTVGKENTFTQLDSFHFFIFWFQIYWFPVRHHRIFSSIWSFSSR